MSAVQLFRTRFLSARFYTLARDDGTEIGRLDIGGGRSSAIIILGGATFNALRDTEQRSVYRLEQGGTRLAGVEAVGASLRRFVVQSGGRTYTLKPASWFGRGFALMESDAEVGRISVISALTGRSRAELPDDLPLPVQAFVIWLVLLIWRRQAQFALVAGMTAGVLSGS